MPEPSQKYVDLINQPFLRIVAHARQTYEPAELHLSYDGEHWVATIAVGPPRTFDRWAVGHGPTTDRAISGLQDFLGLTSQDR